MLRKLRTLIIPGGIIAEPDRINVIEVPGHISRNDSLIVRNRGGRLVAQVLPDFKDRLSISPSKEVFEDDLFLTLTEMQKSSDRSVRFDTSQCSGSRTSTRSALGSSRSRDFSNITGSSARKGASGGGGGFGLRRYGHTAKLNESSFDPKFSSTQVPLDWSTSYSDSGPYSTYDPFASSQISSTPQDASRNISYDVMCHDKPLNFTPSQAQITTRSSSGPYRDVSVEVHAEANVDLTNAMLQNTRNRIYEMLDQSQGRPVSAPHSAVSRSLASSGQSCSSTRSPAMHRTFPQARATDTSHRWDVNVTHPGPQPKIPYGQKPAPCAQSASFGTHYRSPAAPASNLAQLKRQFDGSDQLARSTNASFIQQAPCSIPANATYRKSPSSYQQPTYHRTPLAANATFGQVSHSTPCSPNVNLTYGAPATNITYHQPPVRNATFQQSPPVNATYGTCSGEANAAYQQPTSNIPYKASPGAHNATYQAPPRAPYMNYQLSPSNVTYQAPSRSPNMTCQAASGGQNVTYQAHSKSPNLTCQAPPGASNVTYQAPTRSPNMTCQAPPDASNVTYQAPPRAPNISYQAPTGPNATHSGAPCANASQQGSPAMTTYDTTGMEGTYTCSGSEYSGSELSSEFVPQVPMEERRYQHFQQGNVLSSSRLSEYDSADPKNFDAFQHHRQQMHQSSSIEPEEDSMDDEAFAALMDGRYNVIVPPSPPKAPIPTGKNKTISHGQRQRDCPARTNKSYDPPRVLRKRQQKDDCCCSDEEDEDQMLSYVSSIRHDDYFKV